MSKTDRKERTVRQLLEGTVIDIQHLVSILADSNTSELRYLIADRELQRVKEYKEELLNKLRNDYNYSEVQIKALLDLYVQ